MWFLYRSLTSYCPPLAFFRFVEGTLIQRKIAFFYIKLLVYVLEKEIEEIRFAR